MRNERQMKVESKSLDSKDRLRRIGGNRAYHNADSSPAGLDSRPASIQIKTIVRRAKAWCSKRQVFQVEGYIAHEERTDASRAGGK